MKKAVLLIFLAGLALWGLCLWQWTHSELTAAAVTVQSEPAESCQTQDLARIRRAVLNRSLLGFVYHEEPLAEEEELFFVTFSVKLRNDGLLPAEMVELSLTPFARDVCAYPASQKEVVIAPGEEKTVTLILLTARKEEGARDLFVTCYEWGHPVRRKLTVSRAAYTGGTRNDSRGALSALRRFLCADARAEEEPALPDGFVRVRTLIPDLIEQMRYFGADNFTGGPVDGYLAPCAILSEKAAMALAKAAGAARKLGYRLVIFDAYRPQRAVDAFLRWADDPSDTRMRESNYPGIQDKRDLVGRGYISARSAHSRGSAVDLTLAKEDGTLLDMGTDFDRFGPEAAHGAKGLTKEQAANRRTLRRLMEQAGFSAYRAEWWHYRLKNEPFPDTWFDFPVE